MALTFALAAPGLDIRFGPSDSILESGPPANQPSNKAASQLESKPASQLRPESEPEPEPNPEQTSAEPEPEPVSESQPDTFQPGELSLEPGLESK